MICREKMYLVAENIDDSIKNQTAVYDITLFKSFVDFEKYVNDIPVIINTLLITTNELAFTNTNVERLLNILKSPFFEIKGSIIYLFDFTYNIESVNEFLTSRDIKDWAIYQGDLSSRFISEIVSGEGRQSVEGQIDKVTYRIRASEYIKQQNTLKYDSSESHYITDEELLGGIPDEEEPVDINPVVEELAITNYVVGDNCIERTLFVFLLAQYLSLNKKTLILEKDVEFHRLTEMVTKSGLVCELILMDELNTDINKVLFRIRESQQKLIVIGCYSKVDYDYNFIMDILYSNLKRDIPCFVRECTYHEMPYGCSCSIVLPNTVPDILKCCNSMVIDIEPKDVTFIGMQLCNLGAVNVSSQEMAAVIAIVLSKNNIAAQVVRTNGIILRGESVIYDILGILNRGNRG